MPVLFVCEDNGLGISVRTPAGWIAATYSHRPPMRYFSADGTDLAGCYDTALAAADYVRTKRAPAFLHLSVVRLMAHAGSDAEVSYRSAGEITADYERDPLLGTARLLVGAGLLTPADVADRYEAMRRRVHALADDAISHRRLASSTEIMAPLAPRHPEHVAQRAAQAGDHQARAQAFSDRPPESPAV
jgi:2-oxoisovalerate dehydrogenase E1 component